MYCLSAYVIGSGANELNAIHGDVIPFLTAKVRRFLDPPN